MRELWRRIEAFFRRRSFDRDLDEELRFHLDMKTRETGDRTAARRVLGNPLLLRERARDVWSWRWLDEVLWDVDYAFRQFRQHPGFTFVAVLTLALGIGVNAAVFTLTNGILFRGTPHIDPTNRIVYIQTSQGVSYPDFEDWRAQARSFDGQMAVVFTGGNRTLLDDQRGPREMYDATQLGANAFQVLDQKPILGRDFSPADEMPGAAPVMILSYHLWELRYRKDPGIIGQTVRINSTPASWGAVDLLTSTPTTVIGVMPPDFRFPLHRVDLWLPLVRTSGMLFPDLDNRQRRNFMFAFGRLADGVTLQRARGEMEDIGRRLERTYPLTNRGVAPSVKNFHQFWLGPNAVALYTSMWAAVAFVLLIACANLANLMLARAIGRSREMTLRIALGAGRSRIVRQLLVESIVLSTAGGFVGGVIAGWSIRMYNLVANDPYSYARWDYAIDHRVLAYLIAMSLMTGLLFGVAPAARFSRLDINSILKEGDRGAFGGRRAKRLSALLVIGEMALAIVLLAGAGVMIRSVLTIATSDLGVKTANVLTGLVGLPKGRYPNAQAQISVLQQLTARLKAVPGVESVAIATVLPAGPVFYPSKRAYELGGGVPNADDRGRPTVANVTVSADYFHTVGATVQQGRAFTEADGAADVPVAVVNQQFANLSWPGEDPVGKRLRVFRGPTPGSWLTVVGVVSNIVQDSRTGARFDPAVYRPLQQEPDTVLWVLARTRVPPGSLATAFRRGIEAIDADLMVGPGNSGVVSPLDELLKNNYRSNSVNGILFLIFAAIALLLASVGLYAVVAHSVSQRTQEIGIRTAMGATPLDILALIMKQGMLPVSIGLLVGLPAALAVTPILKSQLVNVSPTDPTSLIAAAATLILSATLGCWIPAHRAVRVEPVVALRHE
jgi:putative ABC transport system permease protein